MGSGDPRPGVSLEVDEKIQCREKNDDSKRDQRLLSAPPPAVFQDLFVDLIHDAVLHPEFRQHLGGKHLFYSSASTQAAAGNLNCQYYYNNLIRSPGQVLIRKSSIPADWSEQIMKNNGSDDAFLWILMLCSGAKAAINEELVYEHVYTGENTSSNNEAMLRSQMEVAEKLKGIASPIGMWAFCRRAKYYCTGGSAHRLRYPDVGLLRTIGSRIWMKV